MMVKQKIIEIIRHSLTVSAQKGLVPGDLDVHPLIETPREEEHGDFSTNVAFTLAPKIRKSPLDAAQILIANMDYGALCDRVETAGKGFINFFVRDDVWRSSLQDVGSQGIESLYPSPGEGRNVLIEFVSANPTGPLHIGHGRGAVVGDVLANILRATKHRVVKEYYVNDAGKQIRTLGESTYARWCELKGQEIEFEKHYYQGDYVRDLAREIEESNLSVPEDREEAIEMMARYASGRIMEGMVRDLGDFGVIFDNYFRESLLYEKNAVEDTISDLRERGHVYEKDGAIWFSTSSFEKDEDRVLVKSDGEKTYFASDIAYHRDKFDRGFSMLIDIWGSDHHGYIPRMKASISALGKEKESLKVLLIQFVTLLREGKPVGMSTRSGQFTTLHEVLDDVGKDAARFFFLMRKSDAHLEFDLDLAKKTTNENPVYYVQYAYARISSILRNAADEGYSESSYRSADVNLLTMKEEMSLIKNVLRLSDVLEGSARSLEPHRITFYLMDLVGKFHSYYNKARVLGNPPELTKARLMLVSVLRDAIRCGLDILGVSVPERM